ncbi:hypothetical protein OB919_19780 [Halobacteria archaeon AArc-curdl1]|uniref:Uncharacterized protein n=1 Tax=Natronosalvus hydrolyticus TaxID=2979988 RepID=A0AAP2ZC32_9EURY|nr:hypothetical protein [Halobacteria archaeon AArc-curdl1]
MITVPTTPTDARAVSSSAGPVGPVGATTVISGAWQNDVTTVSGRYGVMFDAGTAGSNGRGRVLPLIPTKRLAGIAVRAA